MKPFLFEVAQVLYSKYGDSISDCTLVFPNRRASLFFGHYLGKIISRPIWMPSMLTVSDIMFEMAGLKPADPLLLNYKLYQSYVNATKNLEPFDDFYFWGNVMLADFDQIDKYLVNPKKIYTNINDLKAIEQRFDEFSKEQLEIIGRFANIFDDVGNSRLRSRYSQIWANLYTIYQSFTQLLLEQGVAYEGLAYRKATEAKPEHDQCISDKTYVFIGFNALSQSEKRLFHYLKNNATAFFYWDYDIYYLNTEQGFEHEAALFMRDNLRNFPNSMGEEYFNNFGSKKNIKLITAPSDVAQAKIVPDILNQMHPNGIAIDDISTAIVLTDEKLLLSLLTALPDSYSNVNITLEYPLRETLASLFVDALLALQMNVSKREVEPKFYHRDVNLILSHPYLQLISPEQANEKQRLILENRLINIKPNELISNEMLEAIFTPVLNAKDLTSYLHRCIRLVLNGLINEANQSKDDRLSLEVEYLQTLHQGVNRLHQVIELVSEPISHKTFRAYLMQALSEQRVSFYGEPLSGLQMMGFLETRNLDFENLIILSLNDSMLPGVSFKPSFITPSLRKAYGLPDYRHQNAIYAYYFYRLLQRAQNVVMLYADSQEDSRSGEMSRFVQQLIIESGHDVVKEVVKFDLGMSFPVPITVECSDSIQEILKRYYDANYPNEYLSPSALSEFKGCSLKFFLNRIARIAEPDELEEDIDAMGMGSVFHKAMELLYKPFEGKLVTTSDIENLNSNQDFLKEIVFKSFCQVYRYNGSVKELNGRNLLILDRVTWMVRNALKIDMKRVPYQLVALEKKVEGVIPVDVNGNRITVRLGGVIDRLELRDGSVRIVDYKTGSFDPKKVIVNSVVEFDNDFSRDGVFQQLIYRQLYASSQGMDVNDVDVQLWFVRNTDKEYKPEVKISGGELSIIFYEYLKALVKKIFDQTERFIQTKNQKYCEFCTYRSICSR